MAAALTVLSTGVAVALPAALWTVALWDRTSLGEMSVRWAATLLSAMAAITLWLVTTTRRKALGARGVVGLLPAALLAVAVLSAVYLSEDVHHAFVYQPWIKGIVLPLSVALSVAAPLWADAVGAAQRAPGGAALAAGVQALRSASWAHQRTIVFATLAATGVLQALSFCAVATDDLIRYWAVADGILGSVGYPVTTGTAGGEGFYLVELPVYPILIVLGFLAAGHRFLALELPLIVANVLLPFLFYLLARAVGAGRLAALWLALAALSLPHYQLYALGAPEPEPLLAAELALLLWLTVRCTQPPAPHVVQGPSSRFVWAALGLTAAAAVLTRPEGVLYVGPLFAGLAWHFRLASSRARDPEHGWGLLGAAVLCALPIIAFSAFLFARFGILWPAGWANVAGPQFLLPNLLLTLNQNIPYYAAAAGLPAPWLTGPALAAAAGLPVLVGLVRLWQRHTALRFVPVALALNLCVIFISPTYLTLDLFSPATFFRHISVLFPWLVPALALCGPAPQSRVEPAQAPGAPRQRERIERHLGQASPARSRLIVGDTAVLLPVLLSTLVLVLLFELHVLASSTARVQAGALSIFPADPYVLITDLWQAADTLPRLPFRAGAQGTVAVDPAFDYLAFRTQLFAAVRPYDLHTNDAGRAYALASAIAALAGLGGLAAARCSPLADTATTATPS